MIRFRIRGMEFRMHMLTVLTAALAWMLGLTGEVPHVAIAVTMHELAHMLAARMCNLTIDHVDIMPFGGAACIRDIYSAGRSQLAFTSAAGPIANMVLAGAGATLAWFGIIPYFQAALLVKINLALMLFNLIPALPLDGGRLFYAAVSVWLGRRTALRVGVAAAWFTACALLILAVIQVLNTGAVNMTLVILAVFLTASACKEKRFAEEGLSGRMVEVLSGAHQLPDTACIIVVPSKLKPEEAAYLMRPGRTELYAFVDSGEVTHILTGDELARRALSPQRNYRAP